MVIASGITLLWLFARFAIVLRSKPTLRRYWREQNQIAPEPGVFHLVVLGDSIGEGIGATAARYSFVGLAAEYITQQTGLRVVVSNYATAGAISGDLIMYQLPKVNLKRADMILLEIGSNDGHKPRGNTEQFSRNMAYLIQKLPIEKTVVADIPFSKVRKKYQAVLNEVLHGSVNRVYPSRVFAHIFPSIPKLAGDFMHPNNKGHRLWFEAFKPGVDEVLSRRLLKGGEK